MKLTNKWETSIWALNQYLLNNNFEGIEEMILDDLIAYVYSKYLNKNSKLKDRIFYDRWQYFELNSSYDEKMKHYCFKGIYSPSKEKVYTNIHVCLDPDKVKRDYKEQ